MPSSPKVDIRSVVFRDSAIRRWSLPGGWADIGESPGEVAARETLEEAGYRVRPTRLLAVLDKAKHEHPPALDYVYKLFVLCSLESGTPTTNMETDGVAFFASDSLPELDSHRVTAGQVAGMFAHYADPTLPTDFD